MLAARPDGTYPVKRPTRIRIIGKVFRVNNVVAEDLLGECDSNAQTISLRDGQPLECEQDTLLHECIHAVDELLDVKMRETQVKKLATGLLAVLKDNPGLMAYLRKK